MRRQVFGTIGFLLLNGVFTRHLAWWEFIGSYACIWCIAELSRKDGFFYDR